MVQELQLECPPLDSNLGHCGIYMWAAAPETEDRYTVSHMVTPWQRPCSLRSLVWTTSVGTGYSVSKKYIYICFFLLPFIAKLITSSLSKSLIFLASSFFMANGSSSPPFHHRRKTRTHCLWERSHLEQNPLSKTRCCLLCRRSRAYLLYSWANYLFPSNSSVLCIYSLQK